MPRKILILTDERPYHITNRANNRENFYVPLPILWLIFLDCLEQLKIQFHCEIHSFVMMSNHYHLIISTPKCNIGEAMKYFHREVARKANKHSQRINHFFGGRYKWSLIDSEAYYWNCVKYVFRNPVRAGICQGVESYPFSSLTSQPKNWSWDLVDWYHPAKLKINPDLEWLNEPFHLEVEESIRLGLRRREFFPARTTIAKKPSYDDLRFRKGTVT